MTLRWERLEGYDLPPRIFTEGANLWLIPPRRPDCAACPTLRLQLHKHPRLSTIPVDCERRPRLPVFRSRLYRPVPASCPAIDTRRDRQLGKSSCSCLMTALLHRSSVLLSSATEHPRSR